MAQLQKAPWADWQTVRLIGRGSFGTVYEIQRKLVDGNTECAALKMITIPQNDDDLEELYSEGYDKDSITATFHAHLKSIVSEYSFMRKMGGSANIVNCQDIQYIQHEDGIGWDIYIRMELLTPLMKALPANVTEADVIKLGKDICSALVLCKKHGIVHRDIKPQNIFLSPNGDYKLGDFGIAKTVEKTISGTKIGTYKYMAPEVYHNQPYGSSADIYSLGLVLYWLLNRRRMPFMPLPPEKLMAGHDEEARRRRFAGEKLPPPAHGSDGLIQIVLKACAYDPMDRYASAAEMLADLNQLTAGSVKQPPVIIPPRPIEPLEEDAPTTGPIFAIRKGLGAEPVAVEDLDATIGPTFSAPKQPEPEIAPYEFFDKTVRPDFVASPATVEKQEPEPKKRKKSTARKIVSVSLIILLVAVLLFLVLRPVVDRISDNTVLKFESSKTEQDATLPLHITEPEPEIQVQQNEWSAWETTLPLHITESEYEIQEKVFYRSREIIREEIITGEGIWSDWGSDSKAPVDAIDVDTRKVYTYRVYKIIDNNQNQSIYNIDLRLQVKCRKQADGAPELDYLRSFIAGAELTQGWTAQQLINKLNENPNLNFSYVEATITSIDTPLSPSTTDNGDTVVIDPATGALWGAEDMELISEQTQHRFKLSQKEIKETYSDWTEYTEAMLVEDQDTQVNSCLFYRYRRK